MLVVSLQHCRRWRGVATAEDWFMLTCVWCDAPETLGSPFIDGVCFDCLRKETMAAHPAERTRVFLARIDRTQLARPSSEGAAPAEAEAEEVQTLGRRPSRLPKLHVRDF